MWHYIKKDGDPENEGRYLIAYRYKENTELRYFIGDWSYDGRWIAVLDDIEVIAWKEIEPFVLSS